MANRQARSPGNLTKLESQGQVSTKPGFAVESGAGAFFSLQKNLLNMGRTLGRMADRAMAKRTKEAIEAGKTQGYEDAYKVDLGTGSSTSGQKAGDASDVGYRMMAGLQKELGLTQAQAAGFVGNLAHESGNFKTLQEVSPLVKGSRGGFGYAQWTGPRRRQFEAFAKEKGLDVTSFEANYGFLIHELTNTSEGSVLKALRQAGDARSAARIVSEQFLRPGIPHMDSRYKWADRYAKGDPSASQPVAGSGRPGPSGPALALRSDNTPGGEAYNASFNAGIYRRFKVEANQKLAEINDAFGDDPVRLAEELEKAQKDMSQKLGAITDDPQTHWMAEQLFREKTHIYQKSAIAEEDKRVRDGELVERVEALHSDRNNLERMAYLAADNVAAGDDLKASIAETLSGIDEDLERGLITANQAVREKQDVLGGVTSGRIRGTFDSLPDADSKEAYIADMVQQWKEGAEEFSSLSLDRVRGLQRNLGAIVVKERRQADADARIQKSKTERMIKDDLASISQTGVGLSIDGQELTFDQVSAVLGKERATEWERERDIGAATYQATVGMDVMPIDQMMDHLEGLEPKPGSEGYADQLLVLDAARKRGQQLAQLRKEDPALAVDQAFDELEPLREAAYDGDLAAMEQLISSRLDAQEAIGISELASAPLTNAELVAIAQPVAGHVEKHVWQDLFVELEGAYGIHADDVMKQIMGWKGLHKGVREAATGYMRKAALGQGVSRTDTLLLQEEAQIAAMEQAMDGEMAIIAKPNSAAIDYLLANPDTKDFFDRKYGQGLADQFLELHKNARTEIADAELKGKQAHRMAAPGIVQDTNSVQQELLEKEIGRP